MLEKVIENLKKNGFSVEVADTKWKAFDIAKTYLVDGISVGLGGSTTVEEIGLLNYLETRKSITLHNQYEKGISMEENLNRRREGMLSDLFIASSNAITHDGYLVNVDGTGNRVAAQIFGPKKVLLIVGVNKIVKDLDEALDRLKNTAAAKNIERINEKAKSFGKEPSYCWDNIANKFTLIKNEKPGRTDIILVKEELGF
ncbi:MAG: lactate utilization protein [Sulfurospirillaceae bacterium]|jgi:L-lactate utilization protein LutB|nr:lactate utilization protein [Sulfurospirillaceae bacterium]MCK9545708.1 lactate utilization protein [Sulfurospirillaceae bacterium]NLM99588.1 LUD domain-containing protein [Campylobacteraceae bacterium]